MLRAAVQSFASLRLTVALLGAAMVLIFVGTLAQTRLGVWQVVDDYFRSAIAWVDVGLVVPGVDPGSGVVVPLPGGSLIAGLMIANLLAAHAIRFRLAFKRIGVLVLHAGLIVLLAGEFVTGWFANEGLMRIDEGASARFVEDVRAAEFVVVDQSDPNFDRVVSIPASRIARAASTGTPITHDLLPFTIRVERWMPNADVVASSGSTPATGGLGLQYSAQPVAQAAGVDGGETDLPAAYITILRGDRHLGTWLVSAAFRALQPVETDDGTLGVGLRFVRTYKPYEIHLLDFRHDVFVGTTIPKNSLSRVRIVDPERGVDRETLIWMNNPLRYRGETFYQASYKPDGSGTVLQVVRNPGWLLPYAACVLVGGGMAWHFAQSLVAYLRRRSRGASTPPDEASGVNAGGWTLRIGMFAIGMTLALSALLSSHRPSDLDLDEFGTIPVSAGGRVKPMESAARSLLMVAGGRQSVKSDDGRRVGATEFLLELIARPETIADLPVVRVDHPGLHALLERSPDDGARVSLRAIEPFWPEIVAQAERADAIPARQRDGFQREAITLYNRVSTLLSHQQMHEPYVVPPLRPGEEWRGFRDAFEERIGAEPHPAVAHLATILGAQHEGDTAGFEKATRDYVALLRRDLPEVMRRMDIETVYNRASLFTGAAATYVLASLAIIGSFLIRARQTSVASIWGERLRVSGVWLILAALVVHTVAITLRMWLQGRPPVTNLYSSAIFVGWAAALFGVYIERLHPLGVAALASASVGFATLVVAHNLGNDGDTMQMMQAVLDTNFWLATHVVTITLGYSATFLAGALGATYLIARSTTRWLTRERATSLSRMVYGTVCFALLLSFVGTVLGGIWADQSWGRFWGWDPKENGAALVVLINAIILHARWGGMVKQRGVAVLAVVGNIVTAWSWFGTNMLGVGLHAYGFMDSAARWMWIFVGSQAFIAAMALLPARDNPGNRSDA